MERGKVWSLGDEMLVDGRVIKPNEDEHDGKYIIKI